MLDRIRRLGESWTTPGAEPDEGLQPLRVLAAQLLVVTGVGSTLELREQQEDAEAALPPLAAVWAPALVAPLAAIAHLAHGRRPSNATATATRVLDSAAIGAGITGTLAGVAGRREAPSLTPLALASAGILGLVLGRQSRRLRRERERLERRAAVVERLVPRRRPKLDRIVVHV
jgi:hypothetical protein